MILDQRVTLAEHLKQYRSLDQGHSKQEKKIKVAILASVTTKGFKESLKVQLAQLGVYGELYVADYMQYAQEILNPESELYRFQPDAIFLFIDTRTFLGESYFLPYALSDSTRKRKLRLQLNQLQTFINVLCSRTRAKIIVHNFEVPIYSPLGLLENKRQFGLLDAVYWLNSKMSKLYKLNNQVFVLDYELFCSRIGKERVFDYTRYYLADIKVSLDIVPELMALYVGYLRPIVGLNKKCLVLDLDNTLWGGVIGEDGISGIKLGPTPEGRSFWEFQMYIKSLFERGVILAVCSKNNLDDVIEVFRNHPYMLLQEENFAAIQVNWNDKASNLRAIAKEINIGLDSLVFFDDDALNRALVKQELPEVSVVDVPANPAQYLPVLAGLNEFNLLMLTDEDWEKGKMYAQQRSRNQYAATAKNLDDFLASMEMVVEIELADETTLPRVAQLTQKTNQFNLTTKRYQEEDIRTMTGDKACVVLTVKVKDKFGDNGLTGVCIVKKAADEWLIDSLLLSCRIIGRKVEESLLWYLITQARTAKVVRLIGEYAPTQKNQLVADFYSKNGFVLKASEGETQQWIFDLTKPFEKPKYISLKT